MQKNIYILNKNRDFYLPKQGTPVSAGYDLVAVDDPTIVAMDLDTDTYKLVQRSFKLNECINDLFTDVLYLEYRTGVFIEPEANVHTEVFPRSSISKTNLVLANSIGLIDNDYRGEIILRFKYVCSPSDLVPLKEEVALDKEKSIILMQLNPSRIYKKGDKIAQLIARNTVPIKFIEVSSLAETARAAGGFGSTG